MDVLYSDNHLLVVVKPAGVLSQADITRDDDLLTQGKRYIKEAFNKPGNVFLGLVHRLDRPASGVMVFARTSKAAERLSRLFRERAVEKRYIALVEGRLVGNGEREDWLLKENAKVRKVTASHPGAKRAVMKWKCLGSHNGQSLIEVDLLTGRKHQIRIQLAALGHPILGDLRYGAKREFDGQNLALHAYELGFEHPVRKESMHFAAKPPASWNGFFDKEIRKLIGESLER